MRAKAGNLTFKLKRERVKIKYDW